MISISTVPDITDAGPADENKAVADSRPSSEVKSKAAAVHSLGKPFFGASGSLLKQFDEHHALSRKPSADFMKVATPPRSVVGIGGKGKTILFVSVQGKPHC